MIIRNNFDRNLSNYDASYILKPVSKKKKNTKVYRTLTDHLWKPPIMETHYHLMETHNHLMETHYHLWKPFLKNKACLSEINLFLVFNLLQTRDGRPS
jgi:hypothetical protein